MAVYKGGHFQIDPLPTRCQRQCPALSIEELTKKWLETITGLSVLCQAFSQQLSKIVVSDRV
jgi:hypothetical protein